MRLCFCFVLLASISGCAQRKVSDLRFETTQQATALQRAVEAFEQYGNGVHRVDEAAGVVTSRWKDANYSIGLSFVFYRYVATVAPHPGGDSAEVRLTLEAVSCSLRDSRDPDRMAQECTPVEVIPDGVQQRFFQTAESFRSDVSGRG